MPITRFERKPLKPPPTKKEEIFPSANTAYHQIKANKAAKQAAIDEIDGKPVKKK